MRLKSDLYYFEKLANSSYPWVRVKGNGRARKWCLFLVLFALSLCISTPALTAQVQAIDLELLEDLNSDGTPEIAALLFDGEDQAGRVAVMDIANGNHLQRVTIGGDYLPVDLEAIQASDGRAAKIAVLMERQSSGGSRVLIIDPSEGSVEGSIFFGRGYEPIDLEVFSDPLGAVKLVVLGVRISSGGVRVQIADLSQGHLEKSISLGKGYVPLDLEVISGAGAPAKLAVLLTRKFNGATRVLLVDSFSETIEQNISFGKGFDPVDLEVFLNSFGAVQLAVLQISKLKDDTRVLVKDCDSGDLVSSIPYVRTIAALDLEVLPDPGGDTPRLAVLGTHKSNEEVTVQIGDYQTGELVQYISFGVGYTPLDLEPVSTLNGAAPGLSVLEMQSSIDRVRVHVKNLVAGTLYRSVPILFDTVVQSPPLWFEENRVQAHTRLSPIHPRYGIERGWWDTVESHHAATGFTELGTTVYTRHAKSMDEDPWWPSGLPIGSDGLPLLNQDRDNQGIFVPQGYNMVQENINDAHLHGRKLISYYWHMADRRYQEENPGWLCREPDGTPISHNYRGVYLDITGPYREIVLQRLLELAGMGASGLYFDNRHLPGHGCWGSTLEEDFINSTGLPVPDGPGDDHYLTWLDFKARKIDETLAYWQDMVHQQFPDVQFLISTTTIPALTKREMTTRLAGLAVAKSEYHLALRPRMSEWVFEQNPDLAKPEDDIRMALGWTVLRDAAQGRPPHIWVQAVPNEAHVLGCVASLVAHGAVANLDVVEENILETNNPEGATPREALMTAFDLGQKVSPPLSETRPVKYAAVHFSERSRNRRNDNYLRAWQEVLWPLTGAFGVFLRQRVPVGVVNDSQLQQGNLEEYSLLFLPNGDELTSKQNLMVDEFVNKGGVVIENNPSWPWSDPNRNQEAVAALQSVLDALPLEPAIEVLGGPEKMHAVAFRYDRKGENDASRMIIAIVNDFSWVQLTSVENPIPAPEVNPPAPPVESGVEVIWRRGYDLPGIPGPGEELRVFEAISNQFLTAEEIPGGYRVLLPEFAYLSLLIIQTD